MKYLDVRLRQPDWMLHPMQAFIRETDVVRYEELLSWNVRPEEGLEYELFYVEVRDLERYREAVDTVESLLEYRIAPVDENAVHVWACQETRPEDRTWRDAFTERRLVIVPPVRFDEEAAMSMTVVGESDDVQALLADIPDEIDVTVEGIGTYDGRAGTPAESLTDRQLEAIATARQVGYYDVPREAELTEVAAALGCAESTASVLLRRAERNVFDGILDRYGGTVARSAGWPSAEQ